MKTNFRTIYVAVVALLGTLLWGTRVSAEPAPKDLESFVKYMQAHHQAPFDREGAVLPKGEVLRLQVNANAPLLNGTNIKVNQDRNPWPKAEIGSAIDPTSPNNYVVMSNDFRENWTISSTTSQQTVGQPGRMIPWWEGLTLSPALFLSPFRVIRV